MKSIARFSTLFLASALFLLLTPPVHAAIDETLPDAQTLSQLELRAQQANPRDQCYLYTQLVHTMTELAVKEMADGDDDQASATLKQVNHYAHLIQVNLEQNTKRLKNAEMLMHHTTLRLAQALHLASEDDRTTVQATLKQLDLVQDQILDQVFNH
ncbi:hypothetical protein [Edaphobacter dinghuensis]|uniref:DUF5667 domain-containing protein n=1 Tax=Edaphobacter dinghuensis TaxID=1560005 RepID=A0A917M1N4_9BACT|nr:hypothetical protein [Edaphobacter dinghuensis]GGG73534.1 hypothetical protein GCM10011585_15060 [Edaphobacter dinghuensis]